MIPTSATALPAPLRVSQMIVGLWVPQAVHAAAELGVADVLARGPLPPAVVAEKLGTHPDATARLMHALAILGLLEPADGAFALTETGRCLASDATSSRRAWSRLMGGADVWQSWGRLVDCIRTGRKAYGDGLDTFDSLAGDPGGASIFHEAMVEMTRGVAPGIVGSLDLHGVRTVVDVGGGHGALLCAVLEAHPQIEGAVFDLEPARRGAEALFGQRSVDTRARFVAGSFFETAPPAADALLLKSVIHDWDDAASLRILERCREAMSATSRLFVVEPPAGGSGGDPVRDWFVAFSDLNMLVNTGGRERTEAEYCALLEAAWLKVSVRETPTFYKVFEATLASVAGLKTGRHR